MSQTVTQTMSYREGEAAGPSGTMASTLSDSAAFGGYRAPEMSVLHEVALGKARAEVVVSGPNRHKHFRRPIIPFMQAQPPEVIFAAETQGEAALAPPEPQLVTNLPIFRGSLAIQKFNKMHSAKILQYFVFRMSKMG